MPHWVVDYAAFELLAVAALVALARWSTHRRRHPRAQAIPPGFERTDERFVDPTTGRLYVVWFNPDTGERRYQPLGP